MRAVVQRVDHAAVHVYDHPSAPIAERTARISLGLLVLLGVAHGDTERDADRLIDKMATLRIFADANSKMNLDIRQVGGSFLVVSQFTLLGATQKGRRPSFIAAAHPQHAETLYQYSIERIRTLGFTVETGVFGAHMVVESANNGPVTLILDTAEWRS